MTEQKRGQLKIYMGYAAGVGKTYKMLEEAHALKAQGKDIVIGYLEPHGRQDTILKGEGLELIPRKKINYRGVTFEEMDTDRILARRPQICVVDELPHTNVPGAGRSKRWEDVVALLDAGINVQTTMNIQHLESLNDQVRQITGITVRETIPDWLIQKADEVVMVDLTPRALLHRLERGVVYKGEQAQRALENFFREPTLVALRELALREAAHAVEHRIGTAETAGVETGEPRLPQEQQKILVYLTADPKTAMVIRRAKRVSDFLGAECIAVAVQRESHLSGSNNADHEAVERHLNFARNLHIETRTFESKDPASLVIGFARQNQVTQIFVSRPQASSPFFARDSVQKLIDLATDMQIVIVSDRDPMKRR
jgi:two-component system, OmpR family, sensor histidine kinase KdpD